MNKSSNLWLIGTLILIALILYLLSSVLVPFLIAALLAYLADPLVNRMAKLKLPRILAVAIVFTVFILIILLFLFLVIPLLERQIVTLVSKIPVVLMWIQNDAFPWLTKELGVKEIINIPSIKTFIRQHWQQAGSIASFAWYTISKSGHTLVVFFVNLVLIPVVAFYLLRDWPKVLEGLKQYIPQGIKPSVLQITKECDETLSAFFRGQLLVMLSLGVYYTFALWACGLEVALLLGILIGFISIVPYLGFFVGITIALIAQFVQYHDLWHLIYIFIAFIIGHVIENYFLYPYLVGDRIGLHPVAVIFAIFAGGELFGFRGILLALPVAAILLVLLRFMSKYYLKTELYAGN